MRRDLHGPLFARRPARRPSALAEELRRARCRRAPELERDHARDDPAEAPIDGVEVLPVEGEALEEERCVGDEAVLRAGLVGLARGPAGGAASVRPMSSTVPASAKAAALEASSDQPRKSAPGSDVTVSCASTAPSSPSATSGRTCSRSARRSAASACIGPFGRRSAASAAACTSAASPKRPAASSRATSASEVAAVGPRRRRRVARRAAAPPRGSVRSRGRAHGLVQRRSGARPRRAPRPSRPRRGAPRGSRVRREGASATEHVREVRAHVDHRDGRAPEPPSAGRRGGRVLEGEDVRRFDAAVDEERGISAAASSLIEGTREAPRPGDLGGRGALGREQDPPPPSTHASPRGRSRGSGGEGAGDRVRSPHAKSVPRWRDADSWCGPDVWIARAMTHEGGGRRRAALRRILRGLGGSRTRQAFRRPHHPGAVGGSRFTPAAWSVVRRRLKGSSSS